MDMLEGYLFSICACILLYFLRHIFLLLFATSGKHAVFTILFCHLKHTTFYRLIVITCKKSRRLQNDKSTNCKNETQQKTEATVKQFNVNRSRGKIAIRRLNLHYLAQIHRHTNTKVRKCISQMKHLIAYRQPYYYFNMSQPRYRYEIDGKCMRRSSTGSYLFID